MFELTKSYSQKINGVDSKGEVDIYVNAYGNEDNDGDISAPGSFTKTAKEQKSRMRHLINHEKRDPSYLAGFPLEIMPDDSHGLRVISKLNLKKQSIRDLWEDYKLFAEHDLSLEHSIGYKAMKRSQSDPRVITEYAMGEYSTITYRAANEQTPLNGMKSFNDIVGAIQTLELMLRKGNYSDTKFIEIENSVKALTETLNSLMEPQLHSKPTFAEEIKASTERILKLKLA